MCDYNQHKEDAPYARSRLWIIFNFSIFLFLLIFTMPSLMKSFAPTGDTLDSSWEWMSGYAFQHHLQWGKSVLFTTGPLGFLQTPFCYSDHLLWKMSALVTLASWISFGLVFVLILSRIQAKKNAVTQSTLPVAIAWLVGASLYDQAPTQFDLATQSAFIGILLLIFAFDAKSKRMLVISLAVSGLLLAFGSLIKSTSLIIALLLVCIYPLLWLYASRQKRINFISLIPLATFSLSFIGLWIIIGQNITNLPIYFQGTLAISSGYTPAMSIHGIGLQTAAAIIILTLFIFTTLMLFIKNEHIRVAQSLILGVMVFWAWKEGFVRHDHFIDGGHAIEFFGITLLASAVGLMLLSMESHKNAFVSVSGAYLLSLMFALPGTSLVSGTGEVANYRKFVHLISSKDRLEKEIKYETGSIANQFNLSPELLSVVNGHTVNIIPWNLMMTQGYHMDLVASPVFQAYSVYTPYLDHLNARQIWEGRSADKVIYTFASIDGRYPIFDEPATFRALLTCYKTQYAGNPYAVLTNNQCVKPKLTKVEGLTSGLFNKWETVPAHSSYVNVGVQTTIAGHLMDVLYKPNEVHILFRLADGSIKGPYRFIYPLGDDGLFVKYFINGQQDANRLFAKNATGLQRIAAFKLTTTNHTLDYSKYFGVTFYTTNPPYRLKVAQLPLPSRLAYQIENNHVIYKSLG